MKKLLAVLAGIIILSGCGSNGKSTVTFWHAMNNPKDKTLKALIADFEAQNPDVKIDAQYVGKYDNLLQKLLAAAGSGTPPDISQVYENWTTRFKDAGMLIPVADLIKEDPSFTKEDMNDIFPIFVKNNSYDNVLWTMPFNKSIYAFYYNSSLFKQAGVKPPYDMTEFRDIMRTLTKKDKQGNVTQYGFGFKANIDIFEVLLYAQKGKFFDEKETKALFNGPEGVEVLSLLCELGNKEKTAFYSKDYLDNDFASGRVASFIATTPRLSELQQNISFKIGLAQLPVWKTLAPPIAGTNLAVFKKASMTPEKRKACWRFIKFLSSAEGTSKWAAGTSYLPVRSSALKTDIMLKYLNEQPLFMIGINELHFARVDPRNRNWQAVRDMIDQAVEKALLKKSTPKEALDEAAAKVNALLGKTD